MIRLVLLYAVILTGIVFLIIPPAKGEPMDYFLFSDVKLYRDTYIYFWFEKLIVCALAFIIASHERQYREATRIFFWLMVADAIDYGLTYGGVWFNIGNLPITMNILKTIIFGLVILHEWKRSTGSQYFG